MTHRVLRWPVERRLGLLLQTPAHRVVRVLQVTQAHWATADALTSVHAPTPPRPRREAARQPEAQTA
ncbi:hypothetical protein [Variovorax sp. UMC13]|uniref:hypothetical protein n=1 Tax=Variovorax sp. UMC13 TaxID=1862326 RepID=UPI0016043CF3|nr:hypothetical protein [Variovorax sp. UMC13]MBB1604129.1 hypothetical protein [Variovorax sp. UMC13]